MSKQPVLAACLAVLVASAGCRRNIHPPTLGGAPRPEWTVGDVTVIEGKRLALTLRLSRVPDQDAQVSIEASNPREVLVPDSVTFPAGTDTETITVQPVALDEPTEIDASTGLPLDPPIVRDPVLTASTANGSSTVQLHILEDDGEIGHAVGPVAYSTGVALLAGAGTDGIFGTGDEELVTATGVGAGAPVVNRLKIGFLSGDPTCLPVLGPAGEVLILGSGPVVTLTQVQSLPGAPVVTATATLPGKAGGISRPVVVGTVAVMTSRGSDLATSVDDGLIVVQGIGTSTLSVKVVSLPGISTGDASLPVPLDANSVLVVSSGPDFQFATGDEVLSVVRNLNTATPTVVPIFSGAIRGDAGGQPVASGGTIAAVVTAGIDGLFSTADDRLQVIRDVLGTPTPAPPVAIGASVPGAAGRPVATGSDAVLVPNLGADLLAGTSDDEVVVVSPLSADPMTNAAVAAARGPSGNAGALVLLSPSTAVRLDPGVDGVLGTSDDRVVMLTSIPAAPATSSFIVGAVAPYAPLAIDGTSVALTGLGADGIAGTDDDLTLKLSGIGSFAVLSNNPTGAFAPQAAPALIPTASGSSVAGVTNGIDATAFNADDRLSVNVVP